MKALKAITYIVFFLALGVLACIVIDKGFSSSIHNALMAVATICIVLIIRQFRRIERLQKEEKRIKTEFRNKLAELQKE